MVRSIKMERAAFLNSNGGMEKKTRSPKSGASNGFSTVAAGRVVPRNDQAKGTGGMTIPYETQDAEALVLQSQSRVKSAARAACQRFGADFSWADDLSQEIAAQQMAGLQVRLDRRGLDWQMNALLKSWLSGRVQRNTIDSYIRQTTVPPSDPVIFAEIQQIYAKATKAQRRAIVSLVLYGQFTCGDLSRKEQQSRGQALYTLRKTIAPDIQRRAAA